jgi:hypothetical protein
VPAGEPTLALERTSRYAQQWKRLFILGVHVLARFLFGENGEGWI